MPVFLKGYLINNNFIMNYPSYKPILDVKFFNINFSDIFLIFDIEERLDKSAHSWDTKANCTKLYMSVIIGFSRIILEYYCKCCNLIGHDR